ncbi:hypothetical protein HDU91_007365 [Kappamyces sp. JEL0680]|nr:hypothetical protein HDU91_007365 [Kappamyces sp. JEL0680]
MLYQDLAIRAMKEFRKWNVECEREFGHKLFHEVGVLLAGESSQKDSYETQSFVGLQNAGYGGHLQRNRQLDGDSMPYLRDLRVRYPNGYLNKQGGWADSARCIQFIAHLCRKAGVRFVTGSAGTLVGLVTGADAGCGAAMADGSRHYGKLVVATGAWTPTLLPQTKHLFVANGQPVIHIKLPKDLHELYRNSPVWAVLGETGYYGFPPTLDGVVKIARHSDGYIHPNKDGISVPRTAPEMGGGIPLEALLAFRKFIQQTFPALYALDITNTRMCWYTDTLDGDFYICTVPKLPNVILATGGSGHAFKFLPVIGTVVVDLLREAETSATQRFGWRTPLPGKKESSRSGGGVNQVLQERETA